LVSNQKGDGNEGKLLENKNDFLSQKSASFAELNDDLVIPEASGQIVAE